MGLRGREGCVGGVSPSSLKVREKGLVSVVERGTYIVQLVKLKDVLDEIES